MWARSSAGSEASQIPNYTLPNTVHNPHNSATSQGDDWNYYQKNVLKCRESIPNFTSLSSANSDPPPPPPVKVERSAQAVYMGVDIGTSSTVCSLFFGDTNVSETICLEKDVTWQPTAICFPSPEKAWKDGQLDLDEMLFGNAAVDQISETPSLGCTMWKQVSAASSEEEFEKLLMYAKDGYKDTLHYRSDSSAGGGGVVFRYTFEEKECDIPIHLLESHIIECYMKKAAEMLKIPFSRMCINGLVIAVPVNHPLSYRAKKRQSILSSPIGEKIKDVWIISESTASALASVIHGDYRGRERIEQQQSSLDTSDDTLGHRLMVVDQGEGSLDISFGIVSDEGVTFTHHYGDNTTTGAALTRMICKRIKSVIDPYSSEENSEAFTDDLNNAMFCHSQKIKEEMSARGEDDEPFRFLLSVLLMHTLSAKHQTRMLLYKCIGDNPCVKITRQQFMQDVQKQQQEICSRIKEVALSAGSSIEDITSLTLVGRPFANPLLVNSIKEEFACIPNISTTTTSVAKSCAMIGMFLEKIRSQRKQHSIESNLSSPSPTLTLKESLPENVYVELNLAPLGAPERNELELIFKQAQTLPAEKSIRVEPTNWSEQENRSSGEVSEIDYFLFAGLPSTTPRMIGNFVAPCSQKHGEVTFRMEADFTILLSSSHGPGAYARSAMDLHESLYNTASSCDQNDVQIIGETNWKGLKRKRETEEKKIASQPPLYRNEVQSPFPALKKRFLKMDSNQHQSIAAKMEKTMPDTPVYVLRKHASKTRPKHDVNLYQKDILDLKEKKTVSKSLVSIIIEWIQSQVRELHVQVFATDFLDSLSLESQGSARWIPAWLDASAQSNAKPLRQELLLVPVCYTTPQSNDCYWSLIVIRRMHGKKDATCHAIAVSPQNEKQGVESVIISSAKKLFRFFQWSIPNITLESTLLASSASCLSCIYSMHCALQLGMDHKKVWDEAPQVSDEFRSEQWCKELAESLAELRSHNPKARKSKMFEIFRVLFKRLESQDNDAVNIEVEEVDAVDPIQLQDLHPPLPHTEYIPTRSKTRKILNKMRE